MTLYVPSSVEIDRRREHTARVLRNVTIEDARARECTVVLQRIDRRLFMVRARDTVEAGTPVIPGYYHILVKNEDAPMSVVPIHREGAYVEPNSRVYERIAAGDMRNPAVFDAMINRERRAEAEAEREKKREKEDRRTELRERVNAATRTQITMDDTVPWAQNAAGQRRNERPA